MEIVYMKKIINYKMYNTETATMVASYTNGYGCGDFNYISVLLYTLIGLWTTI